MRALLIGILLVLLQASFVSISQGSETADQSSAHLSQAPIALCSDSGAFTVAAAPRARDELGQRHLSQQLLQDISQGLGASVQQCGRSLKPPNVEMVGALYLSLGNQFL